MSIVAWQNAYSLGMPEIDEQHKALFKLIDDLWDALVKRTSVENQLRLIEGLELYTITHFSQEETFMRVIKYPKFDTHKQMHDQFVERIAEEKSRLLAGKNISLDVLYFLKDWLINQILVSDQDYAGFSKAMTESVTFSLVKFFGNLFGKH